MASLVTPKVDEKTEKSDYGEMASLVPPETTERSSYNKMTVTQKQGQQSLNDTTKDNESKQHPTHQSPIPTLSAHQVHITPTTKMPTTLPIHAKMTSDYGEMKSLVPPETTERSDFGAMTVNQDEQKNVNDTNKHDKTQQVPTTSATKMPIPPKMTESSDFGEMKSLVPVETTDRSDYNAMTANQNEQKNVNDTAKDDKSKQHPTHQSPIPTLSAHQVHTTPATKMPIPPKMTESSDYGEMKSLIPPETTERSDYGANQDEQKNVNDTNKHDKSKQHPTHQSPIPTLSAHQVHTTPTTKMPIHPKMTLDYGEMKSLVPSETTERSDFGAMTVNQDEQKNMNDTNKHDKTQQVPTSATKMPMPPKMTESSDYGEMKSLGPPKTTDRSDYNAMTANQNEQKNVNDTNKDDISKQHPTQQSPIPTLSAHQVHTTPATKMPATLPINANITSDYSEMKSLVPPETTDRSDYSVMTANQDQDQKNVNETTEDDDSKQPKTTPIPTLSAQQVPETPSTKMPTTLPISPKMTESSDYGEKTTERSDYGALTADQNEQKNVNDTNKHDINEQTKTTPILTPTKLPVPPETTKWSDNSEMTANQNLEQQNLNGTNEKKKKSDANLATNSKRQYQFFPVKSESVQFKVKAANDACIALTTGPQESWPIVEICIGGWGNTKSAIYKNRTDYEIFSALSVTNGILDDSKYQGFWVKWDGGIIYVGQEGEIFPFLSWVDPEPFPVRFVGMATAGGATGSWKISDVVNSRDHNYQFFPVSSKSVQIKVKAASDACIALTTEARESWPIVEICIGGWNNTKSAIYRNRIDYDIFSVQAITIGILDIDKYCGIWVQWDRGIICVGRKGEISPFLMWVDPQPFQVSFVGVCTTTGTWKIKATNTTNSTITNYFTTFTKEDASNDKTTKAPTPKFFTIFIMKLLEQIASKEKKEAGNLFVSTKSIVIHLNEAGTFNGFGEELRSHILWATFKLNFFNPEVVQNQAKLKLDMMWNNIIDEDIKDILHLLDSTYTPEEGEKVLLASLVDLTIYPANNITSQTVVQYLISGILAPYYRLLGTERLALVVRLINEAINRKNIYEDKTNKPRGLKNSEINVDKRKEFKITPSMIINNEIDGRRKIEGDNAIVKIKINTNNTNFRRKQTELEYKGRKEFRNRNKSIYIDTGTVLKIDKHKNKEVDFKKYVKHKIKDHLKNKHSKLYQNYINKHKLPKEQDDTQRKKHKVIDKFDGYHYEKLQRNRYLSEGFGKLYTIAAHKTVGHKNIKRIPTKPMNRQRMVLQKSFYVADTHNRNSEKVTKKRTKPSKNKKEEDASSENYSEKSRYLTIVFTNSGKKQREFKDEKHVLKKKAYRFVNNFKITKKKGIFEDSSYSDEEKELKFMLQDALRHGDRRFIERRNYETTKMKNINDLSSYSDEEAVLKNNIYKVFGYKQRMI